MLLISIVLIILLHDRPHHHGHALAMRNRVFLNGRMETAPFPRVVRAALGSSRD